MSTEAPYRRVRLLRLLLISDSTGLAGACLMLHDLMFVGGTMSMFALILCAGSSLLQWGLLLGPLLPREARTIMQWSVPQGKVT